MFTVADLRKALENVPDNLEVRLSSDIGVDQGEGEIRIEMARHVTYSKFLGLNFDEGMKKVDYFEIYVNDIIDDDEEMEERVPKWRRS